MAHGTESAAGCGERCEVSRDETARLYAASYTPTMAQLTSGLGDLGDGLAAQFAELERAPTAERAERIAYNLDGARRHVLKLRQVIAEGEGGAERDGQ